MKKIQKFLCLFIITSLLVAPITVSASLPITVATTLYVDAARIGEADSFLISKNGKFMLVDTGLSTDSTKIINMLSSRSVTNLKALVITHYDVDHVGSFLNVIDYIKNHNGTIDHIYGRKYTSAQLNTLTPQRRTNYVMFINGILRYLNRSSEEFNLSNYDTVAVATKANELFGSGDGLWIFPTRTNPIANFTLDGNTTVTWLNKWDSYIVPGMDPADVPANFNNDSLTFKLTYENGEAMLFTGDISWTPQQDLVDNCYSQISTCSILKAPHHGIPDYQKPSFITAVNPSYTLATTDLSYNRLPGMITKGKYGMVYYTDTASDFCTIAVRLKAPSVYLEDTALSFYTNDTN